MRIALSCLLVVLLAAPAFASEIVEGVTPILVSQFPIGEGGGGPRSPTANAVYSNITNTLNYAVTAGGVTQTTGTKVTKLLADDIQCAAGGVPMVQFSFSVYNANTTAFTAQALLRFYTDNANKPGTYLGGYNFTATSYPATSVGLYYANVTPTWNIPANGKMWIGTAFATTSGSAAQRSAFGVALYNPVDVGSSTDEDYLSTNNGASSVNAFSINNPAGSVRAAPYPGYVANHYYEVVVGTGACCISSPTPSCSIMTQAACTTAGGMYLGNNSTCGGLDCNANGTDDKCDLAAGTSQDCNGNGIPDECDIAGGMPDVDQNGIPDSCQPDCNANGVIDACEMPGGCLVGNCGTAYPSLCGTGGDCQPDGTLDACQLGPWTVYNAGACDGINLGGPDGGWATDGFLDKFQIVAGAHRLFKSFHLDTVYFMSVTRATSLRLRIYRLPTGSIPTDLPSFATAVPIFDHTYTTASGEFVITSRASCYSTYSSDNYDATGPAFDLTPPGYYAIFVNFPGYAGSLYDLLWASAADDGFGTCYQWGASAGYDAPALVADFPLAWNLKLLDDDTNDNGIPDECEVPRACCYPDGHCEYVTEDLCGGEWGAQGSTCTPNLCPQPTGSCCHADGTCTMTVGTACTETWTLNGTCTPNPCPQPTGSCCYPDGTCAVTLLADCTETWTMFGTCTPNPCPQPTGACCHADGTCMVTLLASCTETWTMFGGCTPNPCPQPIGACCDPDGTCAVTTEAQCVPTGIWHGDWPSCDPNSCPLPTGACCFGSVCIDGLLQADCVGAEGWWAGPLTTCDPDPCQPPTGACCFLDGHCEQLLQTACTTAGGQSWIQDQPCDPNLCQQPSGSCCHPDGTCAETLQAACTGTWTMFGVCEPNPCPCPHMGDFNGDSAVDGLDIQGFVDCVLGGNTDCRCGDFDASGAVDLGDLADFVAALLN